MNNNNYINNDADFETFVNSTLNYDNNNNRSPNQDKYDLQITSILANSKIQLKFSRLFAYYFANRPITNDYTYSSQCCVCMDTNNYCIKICDCSEVKYCYKCFKDYVKTSILSDPIKINSALDNWHSTKQNLDFSELVNCSICHKSTVLGIMENIINSMPPHRIINNTDIGDYLLSLDFFSETVPQQDDFKWYILFNQDGRVRYNLVPLEQINNIPSLNGTCRDNSSNNSNNNSNSCSNADNETMLRQSGFIHIFEILQPTPQEHQQIKAILHNGENQPTERTRRALQTYNPNRLKLL
jgi:hypothetical protein